MLYVAGVVHMPTKGPTGKPFLTAACFDGNAKANRLASAGRGRANSVSDTCSDRFFFGAVHQEMWKLHSAGPLPLSAAYPGSINSGPNSSSSDGNASGSASSSGGAAGSAGVGPDSAAAAGDDELVVEAQVEHNCHPNLSCARESSVSSSISDEHGIVGAVCAHGQPLLELFLAMPAHERLLFYDYAASYLAAQVDLGVMYLDTGCIFAAHWRLHMPGPPPFDIKLPWWHARGHGEDCYLKNSGFYKPGKCAHRGCLLCLQMVFLLDFLVSFPDVFCSICPSLATAPAVAAC
jgi:hypothetical protein